MLLLLAIGLPGIHTWRSAGSINEPICGLSGKQVRTKVVYPTVQTFRGIRWQVQRNPINVLRPSRYQRELFPLAGAPDGLLFEPEIMTVIEEAAFLDVIKTLPFSAFRMHGVDARRRVVRFGLHYLAGSATMTLASGFPLSLEPLRVRAAAIAGIPTRVLSESLVTEYAPGAGIGWHRDSPPFGIVCGISFGGGCRMRFQRGEGEQRQTWTLELPPRSLYVLSGVAREEWQHSIPPVKDSRWSVTFRTLKARDADVSGTLQTEGFQQ